MTLASGDKEERGGYGKPRTERRSGNPLRERHPGDGARRGPKASCPSPKSGSGSGTQTPRGWRAREPRPVNRTCAIVFCALRSALFTSFVLSVGTFWISFFKKAHIEIEARNARTSCFFFLSFSLARCCSWR